jgi:trimeric autotransporter adhesin
MFRTARSQRITPWFVLSLALLLLLSTPWLAPPPGPPPAEADQQAHDEEEGKRDKYDRIDLAIQHEVEKTRDPATGQVPRERLMAAYQLAERKRQRQIAQATRGAIPNLSWRERGPNNVAGRVRTILIDEGDPSYQTVWTAGVAGGLWKTTQIDAQDPQWQSIDDFFDNLAITSIAQDPNDPAIMYFGTGEGFYNSDAVRGLGIWKSIDHGDTWTQLSSTVGSSFRYLQKLVVAPNSDLWACTRNAGLQRSTDGGLTWTKVLGAGVNGGIHDQVADLEISANGDLWAGLGLVFSPGQLYHSTDGGNTWSAVLLPGTGFERIEIACAPSDANRIYVLTQDPNTRACKNIFRSDDAGVSWTATFNPSAIGMSNFCRSQAWYDLIAAVDPNDPDHVFIGGVDLLTSSNAGQSWTQISQWYGGNGIQYVHADQHAIVFQPGNSNIFMVGNDGGVYRSTNGQSLVPNLLPCNQGLNITQYYAGDLSPLSRSNEFLAGSQDNGTQRYTQPGINSTVEVTGGDGGFCHIDADEPQVQLSSYVYNLYRVTTDSWGSFQTYTVSGNQGRFINPTDYDDQHDRLYACYSAGQYLRFNDIGSTVLSPSADFVSVSAFGGGQISALKVSPNLSHRVFFGLDNGRVVRVDNAHLGSSLSGTLLGSPPDLPAGYISSIDVEKGDDDHLLVTFSNYGLASVWETRDGGATWRNLEGDLPDMPVRWGIFHPFEANQALLATELGVWTCDNLSETSLDWEPSNTGLANVRTDMLQFRPSDSLLIAATHGRGLYSSEVFREVKVRFQQTAMTVREDRSSGAMGCRPYRDYQVPVEISRASATMVEVAVSVVGGSATPLDYDFPNGTLVAFPANDPADQYLTLRVYDDGQPESGETLQLSLASAVPGMVQIEAPISLNLDFEDRDPDLSQLGVLQNDTVLFEDFEGGSLPNGWLLTHAGSSSDDFQFGTAAMLSSPGWTIPTNGNGSLIAATNDDACACDKSMDRLISPLLDLSLASNVNLSFRYFYDGPIFDAGFRFSTDGGATWSGIYAIPHSATWNSSNYNLSAPLSGQSQVRIAFEFNDTFNPGGGFAVDELRLTANQPYQVRPADWLGASDEHELGPWATVNYFDAEQRLIATLENLSSADFGCTEVRIDRSGTGSTDFWDPADDAFDLADKTVLITPTLTPANALYRLTLYYRAEEVAGWEAATGKSWTDDARIVKSGGPISQVTPATPYPAGPIEQVVDQVAGFGPGNDHRITATFSSGFSGFGVGDPGEGTAFPVEWVSFTAQNQGQAGIQLRWAVGEEVNLSHYEVQRQNPTGHYVPIGRVSAAAQASYQTWDRHPQVGTNRYRLRSVDLDGSQSYSSVVEVNTAPSLSRLVLFPNPFEGDLWMQLPTRWEGTCRLALFAPDGRQVWQGKHRGGEWVHLDQAVISSQWASGIYLLKVTNLQGIREVHKVIRR